MKAPIDKKTKTCPVLPVWWPAENQQNNRFQHSIKKSFLVANTVPQQNRFLEMLIGQTEPEG